MADADQQVGGGPMAGSNLQQVLFRCPDFGSFGGAGRSVPQFVARDSGNVSAILGKAATLTCRVRAVGNRTVSGTHGPDV